MKRTQIRCQNPTKMTKTQLTLKNTTKPKRLTQLTCENTTNMWETQQDDKNSKKMTKAQLKCEKS